jgi:hypothetical protein
MEVKRKKIFTGSDKFKERRSWEETGQLPGGEGLGAKKKKSLLSLFRRERQKQEMKKSRRNTEKKNTQVNLKLQLHSQR